MRGEKSARFCIGLKGKNTTSPLLQGLDYEAAKQRILVIGVNNEAPYLLAPHSQQLSQSTCSVTVHVLDVDEGPVFKPCLLRLDVKECENIGTAIGRFVAEDPETGNSEGIRYETTLFTFFNTAWVGCRKGEIVVEAVFMCVHLHTYQCI